VGSFGFKVTTSLWHFSRVSNPRTAEIGSVTSGVWPLAHGANLDEGNFELVAQAGGPC
jgi:hypothetical protein